MSVDIKCPVCSTTVVEKDWNTSLFYKGSAVHKECIGKIRFYKLWIAGNRFRLKVIEPIYWFFRWRLRALRLLLELIGNVVLIVIKSIKE